LPETLACYERLTAIARYEVLPIRSTPSQCATIDLVRVERVLMPDRSEVVLAPAPALRCSMAEAITSWIRDDVGPAAAELGASLATVTDLDSYQCRPRNNIPGAKLSEHGKANALDVGMVKLKNGGQFDLTDPKVSKQFRETMKASACARFMTVLGPGSDSFHNNHIHLDLEERSRGYKICQWNVLDPVAVAADIPLPRPRPIDLASGEAKTEEPAAAESKPAAVAPRGIGRRGPLLRSLHQ
jgi:hypothetical protein